MDVELKRLLQDGIEAARAGGNERARDLLLQVIAQDQGAEAAWLWLSAVVNDPEERAICLENVLILNPHNRAALDGLRWLQEQGHVPARAGDAPPSQPPSRPASGRNTQESSTAYSLSESSPARRIDIDPFGCPYCGGSISPQDARCDHCGGLVARRYRKRSGGLGRGWVTLIFLMLGALVWLEGFFVGELAGTEQIPTWLDQTVVRFLVGPALLDPARMPEVLATATTMLNWLNTVLVVLCGAAAAGLALRIRLVYFASFVVAGMVAVATGVGLLTGLTGWLPAVFRLGLVAVSFKWLSDISPSFEWDTRHYNADTDLDLQTDMDYYNRGKRYFGMGMWAKAAAHWKVASQLAPGQAQYHIALANAYVKMGYPAAALGQADRALVLTPEDQELQAFRESLSHLEEAR